MALRTALSNTKMWLWKVCPVTDSAAHLGFMALFFSISARCLSMFTPTALIFGHSSRFQRNCQSHCSLHYPPTADKDLVDFLEPDVAVLALFPACQPLPDVPQLSLHYFDSRCVWGVLLVYFGATLAPF